MPHHTANTIQDARNMTATELRAGIASGGRSRLADATAILMSQTQRLVVLENGLNELVENLHSPPQDEGAPASEVKVVVGRLGEIEEVARLLASVADRYEADLNHLREYIG